MGDVMGERPGVTLIYCEHGKYLTWDATVIGTLAESKRTGSAEVAGAGAAAEIAAHGKRIHNVISRRATLRHWSSTFWIQSTKTALHQSISWDTVLINCRKQQKPTFLV